MLLSQRGVVLRADVHGSVMCKTLLSGMPECKFGVNDKLLARYTEEQQKGSKPKDPFATGTEDKGI